MKKGLLFSLLLAFLFSSCINTETEQPADVDPEVSGEEEGEKEEEDDGSTPYSICAVLPDTLPFLWSENDSIYVNGAVSRPLSAKSSGGKSAVFFFEEALEPPCNIIFPVSLVKGDGIVELPSLQPYAEGQVAKGVLPLAGIINNLSTEAELSGLEGLVKLTVTGSASTSSISRVYLTGCNQEQLSGVFTVRRRTMQPADSGLASKTVGVDCGGITLPAAGIDVYIAVPVGVMQNGYRIRIVDNDRRYMEIASALPAEITSTGVLAIPAVEFVPTGTLLSLDDPDFLGGFSGGDGTEGNPYLIGCPEDLVKISELVEIDNEKFARKCYRQVCDIDMSSYSDFTPICKSSSMAFRGVYDGQGYSIRNLTLDYHGGDRATALFGCCGSGALISGVCLENVRISSNSFNTASIAGYLSGGTVRNCNVSGSVYGSGSNSSDFSYLGGIVGRVNRGTVEGCSFKGSVTTTSHHAGGIVGESDGSTTIRSCRFASGSKLAGGYHLGGIVGYMNNGENVISDCICEGDVMGRGTCVGGIVGDINEGRISSCSQASGSTVSSGLNYVAGIVGNLVSNRRTAVIVDNCVSYGDVIGQHGVAGIVGNPTAQSTGDRIVISNCAKIGGVVRAFGTNSSTYALVGGIAGWATGSGDIRIVNCCSVGTVLEGTARSVGGFGGIAAVCNSTSGRIVNAYSDITAGDILYMDSPVSGISFHGAILGRNMNLPYELKSCFWDLSYREGPGPEQSSIHTMTDCKALTPGEMTGGTLLSLLNSGVSFAAAAESTVAMHNWVAGTGAFPIPEGLPADTGGNQSADDGKLRISIIGDSISTFAGWEPSPYTSHYPNESCDITSVEHTWWYRLADYYMDNTVIDSNISFSNTTVTKNLYGDSSEYWFGYDFCSRFISCRGMGNPDVIIIHGGTNDYYHNYGELLAPGMAMRSDTMPAESVMEGLYALADACSTLEQAEALCSDTFCESYIKLVRMMKLRHPSARILCIAGDWLTAGLENSILHIAEHYGCRTVDFVKLSGFQNSGKPMTKYSGCHPDRNGMDYMARTIYEMHGSWMSGAN